MKLKLYWTVALKVKHCIIQLKTVQFKTVQYTWRLNVRYIFYLLIVLYTGNFICTWYTETWTAAGTLSGKQYYMKMRRRGRNKEKVVFKNNYVCALCCNSRIKRLGFIIFCTISSAPNFSKVHGEFSVLSLIVLYPVHIPLAWYMEKLVLYLLLYYI